jgi:hypothetical protein
MANDLSGGVRSSSDQAPEVPRGRDGTGATWRRASRAALNSLSRGFPQTLAGTGTAANDLRRRNHT